MVGSQFLIREPMGHIATGGMVGEASRKLDLSQIFNLAMMDRVSLPALSLPTSRAAGSIVNNLHHDVK